MLVCQLNTMLKIPPDDIILPEILLLEFIILVHTIKINNFLHRKGFYTMLSKKGWGIKVVLNIFLIDF